MSEKIAHSKRSEDQSDKRRRTQRNIDHTSTKLLAFSRTGDRRALSLCSGQVIDVLCPFVHGPCNVATGSDSDDIFRGSLKKLASVLSNNPQEEVNIVGHSRGGYIAMELARHLQSKGYRVNFLGLYDAVDSAPGFGEAETIPSNVDYAAHALSNPSLRNRTLFNTADHGPEDSSKMIRCDIRMFRATHGGVGGAPYSGGYKGLTTPFLERNISAEVDRWMRDRAQGAGVNIPDAP